MPLRAFPPEDWLFTPQGSFSGRGVSRARRVREGVAGAGRGWGRGGRGPAPAGCRAPGGPGSVRGGGGGGADSWRRAILLRRAHGRTGEPTLEARGAGVRPADKEPEQAPRAASGRQRPPDCLAAPSSRRCQSGAMGGSTPARAA
uniref:laforin-like n=1 Tax=Panthera onca TaxID=9690 RepID=UPI002953D6E8|nr:laforin-like [Panthera onca]